MVDSDARIKWPGAAFAAASARFAGRHAPDRRLRGGEVAG